MSNLLIIAIWLLHNRLAGGYLCEDGSLTLSQTEAAEWVIEADGAGTRIKSRASGKPLLQLDAVWEYGGFDFATKENAGWYTLCPAPGKHLLLKDGKAAVGISDRNTDFSAHWTFVRNDSGAMPYAIGADCVRESSFLGERTAKALSPTEITSDYHGPHSWTLSKDISDLPQFSAKGSPLITALYNMALEESLLDIRPQDGTFMAGMLWPGHLDKGHSLQHLFRIFLAVPRDIPQNP